MDFIEAFNKLFVGFKMQRVAWSPYYLQLKGTRIIVVTLKSCEPFYYLVNKEDLNAMDWRIAE